MISGSDTVQIGAYKRDMGKLPKVPIAKSFASACDLFIFARAANAIPIADPANVRIEFDCKNREAEHHDRLHEEGLGHTRNCMNGVEVQYVEKSGKSGMRASSKL